MQPSSSAGRAEAEHPALVRATHWINAAAMIVMILSGWRIYNAVTALLRVLAGPSRQKRVAMMAPDPPQESVERPNEFGKLKRQLLDAKGDSVAITAALRGAGGYGKTTLARKLAHDPEFQDF